MKTNFFLVATFALMFGCHTIKAESTVFFFLDFRFWNSEYIIKVNGKEAFSLIPEGKPVSAAVTKQLGYTMMYNMVARKVIFSKPGSYVEDADCPSISGNYHGEINMHIEDGETYYIVINSNMKRTFYMEFVDEKSGLKLLKKAQTNKKYTFNEDFVYDEK